MATRSTAMLTTGSANTAKLFVAALAFTGAYVGVSAYDTANSAPRPAQTITLSARTAPLTTPATPMATSQATAQAAPGTLVVGSPVADQSCAVTYETRGVVVNPDPAKTAFYHWRLARWSPSSKTWQTYLSHYDGFAGERRSVEWRTEITRNPGLYRVELDVRGAKTVKSPRFQVSC